MIRAPFVLSPRKGFTLIELLVVISIIGILASLILPAVVNARRQGRRTQCLNNMKNIGAGMFNLISSKGKFPASGYWDVTLAGSESQDPKMLNKSIHHPNQLISDGEQGWQFQTLAANPTVSPVLYDETKPTLGLRYSWVVELLPFIGSQSVYDAWDFSATDASGTGGNRGSYMDALPSTGKRGNRDLANTYLELLVCPEDSTASNGTGSLSYVVNGGFAYHWIAQLIVNGSGTAGPNPTSTVLRQPDGGLNFAGGGWHRENLFKMGLMFMDTTLGGTEAHRRHSLESIRDGQSFTVMLSENINTGPGSTYLDGVVTTNWACPFPFNTSFFVNSRAVFGEHIDPVIGKDVNAMGVKGLYKWSAANTRGADAYPVLSGGPNDQGGINGDLTGINEGKFPYPNSMHPGGVHIVMCDGSVRFLPENVAGEIWARLVTPNGGSVVLGTQDAIDGRYQLNFEQGPTGSSNYTIGNRQIPLDESSIPSG